MAKTYDAIVVGARCAGSPTAMLLARKGYDVLVVDKATFPSDTMSSHLVHAPGVAALRRWGLLDNLVATGCPPIETYAVDFGPIRLAGTPKPSDGSSTAYCPRRTVLDALLVDAAVDAGAEVREHFTVDEVLIEDGHVTGIRGRGADGRSVTEHARIVIGADGKGSLVAKAVDAKRYNERPTFEALYYTYFSDLEVDGIELYVRPERAWGAIPTHDGLTCVIVGWPRAEFEANRSDVEGNFFKALELGPAFAERVRDAQREARFVGTGDLPNFYREPYGPGWALVGDAGYHKDPCTAQGISDAFRDAELCVRALDEAWSSGRDLGEAMADYQHTRDESTLPLYDFTCQLAALEPPPPELQELLGAVHGNQDAMDAFVSMLAGTVSPAEFFAPENTERIMTGVAG